MIDDEPGIASALVELLKKQNDIEVVAVGNSIAEAESHINTHQPDVLFLDILLGNNTAFELLDRYQEKHFQTIFTTAHSNFAIQAIRAGAFDYLLKPIGSTQLSKTLERLKQGQEHQQTEPRYQLTRNYLNGNCQQIALPDSDGFRFVQIADIVRIKAQGNYCDIFFSNGDKFTVTRKLKTFDGFLSLHGFCRVHHSHMINLSHLQQYSKTDGGKVTVSDGETIYVSKLYKNQFLEAIGSVKRV